MRWDVAAEVHRELMLYVPGMQFTAARDGDAKQMCDAGGWGSAAFNMVVQLVVRTAGNVACLNACGEVVSRARVAAGSV